MGMSTRKVSLGCLPGYESKSAFKFSYSRLWILYFDRLPIYWCITRFFNIVRLLWWRMCRSEVCLLQTKWHSWRSIEWWTKVLYQVTQSPTHIVPEFKQINQCLHTFLCIFLSRDDDNPHRVNWFRSTAWTGQTFTTHNIEHRTEPISH